MKYFICSFLGVVFSVAVLSSAAAAPLPSAPIATVNIQHPSIVSQQGNTFKLSFSLANREGSQSDIVYGVQLVTKDAKSAVADEKVFDDAVSLAQRSSVEKTVTYVAPAVLSGSFQLLVTAYNKSGFPLAMVPVADVTLTASSQGISILPGSCSTAIVGSSKATHTLAESVLLDKGQSLQLTCAAKNTAVSVLSATPSFKAYYESVYGDVAQTSGGDTNTIAFGPGETKAISLVLPMGMKPKNYQTRVALVAEGMESNAVIVSYSIKGTSATIQNLSLDKESYEKGDVARLSLLWSATNADPAKNTPIALTVSDIVLKATIKSGGADCVAPITKYLSRAKPKPLTDIIVPVTNACANPKVSVVLTDLNGSVLDQKEFTFGKPSLLANPRMVGVVIGVILVLLIVSIVIRKKKKHLLTHTGMLVGIAVFFGGQLLFSSTAHADVYAACSNDSVNTFVNLDNGDTYAPGASLRITTWIKNISNPYSPVSVKLTAANNSGSSTILIPPQSLALGAQTNTIQVTPFSAPLQVSPPTYHVNFVTSCDEPVPPGHQLVQSFGVDQGYDDTGFPHFEGWASFSSPAQQAEQVVMNFNYREFIFGGTYRDGSRQITVPVNVGDTYAYHLDLGLPELSRNNYYQVTSMCVDMEEYNGTSPTIAVDPSYQC